MDTEQRAGSGNALPRAITALTARLRERIGAGAFMPDRAEYVSDLRDNLVPGVVPELQINPRPYPLALKDSSTSRAPGIKVGGCSR